MALHHALQNPRLTPENARILNGVWDQNFANYDQLAGQGLKDLDSELGSIAREYMGGSPADKVLGREIENIKFALRQGLEQGMPPDEAGILRAANSAYRQMIPVNKAASSRADRLATPRALEKAIARQRGTDVTRMAADPLLGPAVRTLGQTIPDSGTASRSLIQNPMQALAGGVGALGAAAAYSPFGTRLLLGQTAGQRGLAYALDPAMQATIAALRE